MVDGFSQVIVFGAGAVGSYLGARVSPPAILVGRPDHVAAIRANGLRITGEEDDCVRLEAVESCPVAGERALVLVAVKMGDIPAAAAALEPRLRDDTVVAVLSNGLDPDRQLADVLRRPVARVIVQLGVTLEGPGEVSCWGGGLMFGPGVTEDRIAACFAPSGLRIKRTRDLARIVWQKLAVNCVANPLSALTGRNNRDLITPELAPLRGLIVEEVRQLAATEGVELSADLLPRLDAALGKSRNRTSMLQDIRRGRPTEIEHLNGLVASMAVERGLAAPVNAGLAELVRLLIAARRA